MILSHEFGHFSMAKLAGIYVYDFSLGMGPKLLSFKRKETQYSLRLFPIGGHCQMMGEDEISDDPRSFNKKKVWQRMLVIAGGPAMNFITAMLLFIIIFMMMGTPSGGNMVGNVITGQAAEAAGILPGDIIVEINGQAVNTWLDISPAVASREAGQTVDVVVQRDSGQVALSMQPYFEAESGRWLIGIMPAIEKQNLFTAIKLGVKQSVLFTKALILALVGMIAGSVPPDVTGPVGVVTIIGEASSYGLQSLLMIAAILSVNLAVVNLLPIPALDGARLIFLAVEGVRRKPFNREREGMVHLAGFMLLIVLMIVLTFKDVARLISGG